MSLDLEISIAFDRYDRHFPFFDGTVKAPAGLRYRALQVGQSDQLRDGTGRHERMIHQQAFDVAEFSMSTYLMAINRGLPITGVPIFPRRLFSQSCMFVRADNKIEAEISGAVPSVAARARFRGLEGQRLRSQS